MSFWELVVVGIVALLVLGPEKLPGAIRTVTGTIRSIRQFGNQMKSELADELRVHELHEKLRQAEEKGLLGLTSEEIQALAQLRNAAADVNDPYGPAPQQQDNALAAGQSTASIAGPAQPTPATPSVQLSAQHPASTSAGQPTPLAPASNRQPSHTEHHEHNIPPRS